MNIREKLLLIQAELHAPKNQYNNFGKYTYRNCEDILEAVKPLCVKHGAVLTVSDSLLSPLEKQVYVRAVATLSDIGDLVKLDDSNTIWAEAHAREAAMQKGMNDAQITGSTSSYARKYALNGLFCIDDTKDDDFNNTNDSGKKPFVKKPEPVGTKEVKTTQPVSSGFLGKMQIAKAILKKHTGDDNLYYITLEDRGYKKSNQVEKKNQEEVLVAFRKLADEVKELAGGKG
jgi:hypothetical protein